MSSEYEKIYTVFDYWDGIRTGIADYNGMPHYYERAFVEDQDDWADYFFLKPIDEKTFHLAMEDWAIWQRWYVSKSPIETHPALPEDRERYEEIKETLAQKLKINPNLNLRAKGKIQADFEGLELKHATNPFARLQIKWQLIS